MFQLEVLLFWFFREHIWSRRKTQNNKAKAIKIDKNLPRTPIICWLIKKINKRQKDKTFILRGLTLRAKALMLGLEQYLCLCVPN